MCLFTLAFVFIALHVGFVFEVFGANFSRCLFESSSATRRAVALVVFLAYIAAPVAVVAKRFGSLIPRRARIVLRSRWVVVA
jgi:uncharacterized membrane protein